MKSSPLPALFISNFPNTLNGNFYFNEINIQTTDFIGWSVGGTVAYDVQVARILIKLVRERTGLFIKYIIAIGLWRKTVLLETN